MKVAQDKKMSKDLSVKLTGVERETEMNLSPGSSSYKAPNEDNLEGLTENQAQDALEKYGYNEIPEKRHPLWWIYVKQYLGAMPIMIALAGILALCVRQWADFAIILLVLLINTSLGF